MVELVPAAKDAGTAVDRMVDAIDKVKPAVDNTTAAIDRTKPAVDGMSNAVNGAKTATDGLTGSTGRAGQGLSTQSGVVSRLANDYNRLSEMQKRINATTGVTGGLVGVDRGADIAAYGQQMDSLRAKYNPLFAAQQQYKATLAEINRAVKVGAISEKEHADAIMNTKVAFTSQVNALRGVTEQQEFFARSATRAGKSGKEIAAGAGLARDELVNLSRQAQDVFVSLTSGQSFGTVLIQQGTQIADVFAASRATLGSFFKQVGGWFSNFFTAGRIAFSGVAASIGLAALALNSYLSAQQKVQTSLLGAGRASGATANGVNAIAEQGASTFGFSVSESRELASALVVTGKVANDNILPIVKMGYDVAIALGTDAKGAAEALASAFSDPVAGADALNQRLGFLDAATKQNIANLVAQNRQYDAQRVLIDAVKSSLDGFSATESLTTKGWSAITNAISNAWDATGKFFASLIGLGESLETRLERARAKLVDLQASTGPLRQPFAGGSASGVDPAAIAAQTAEVERLAAAWQKVQFQSMVAAAAQKSFVQQQTVRNLTPEIAQQEALNNQLQVLAQLMDRLANDEAAGAVLKQLGVSFEQLASAVAKAQSQLTNFKSDFDKAIEQQKLQSAAITAFSPSAKGQAAFNSEYAAQINAGVEASKAATLAEGARALAIKQVSVAMSEQARARALAANQSVASAQLDIDMVGKSIAQQAEMRANLQARQTLEQQASQNRTGFDNAEYERLQKINAEMAKRTQLAAQSAANDNATFAVQTAFLSNIDQQIASVQRNLHGNAWQDFMNDGLSATMRLADGLRQLAGITKELATGFATDFVSQIRNGASAMDALKTAGLNALGKIADKLASMAVDNLWQNAFGGASSGAGGGLTGLLGKALGIGGGGSAPIMSSGLGAGTGGLSFPMFSANGNAFDMTNVVPFARGGAFTNSIVDSPTLFKFAKGTGMMGEAGPEAIMPLTRGPNGKLGVAASGNSAPQNVHVTVGVSVDENGNLQAYVKDVAQSTTAAGVNAAMTGPTFTSRVAKATKQAQSLRQIA